MAKSTGIDGKASGKLGARVYAVSCGEQVIREYNGNVKNPSTTSQVAVRSKLKLASQIAAAVAPVIAIPRQGLKSPRNLFIKKNHGLIIVSGSEAQVSYENLQLTNGSTSLPALNVTRVADTSITVKLVSAAPADISRVVYAIFIKTGEEKLQLVASGVSSTPGADRDFQKVFSDFDGDVVVYAYGMKDLTANATAKYNNYTVQNGVDVAGLISSRKLNQSDIALSQTRGTTLFAGETENVAADPNQRMVYITASGPGTVAGDGFTNGRKAVTLGANVTVTATPSTDATFLGWYTNGSNQLVSSSASYTFAVNADADLVARFNNPNDDPDPGDDQD